MMLARSLMFVAAFGLAWSAASARAEKWDMATPYPDGYLSTGLIREFASEAKALTKGKVDITVHANGSVFKHPEIKRAVQDGSAQLGEILVSSLAHENPVYFVDSIPFLVSDYDAARKLDGVSRPYIEKMLEKGRLKLLFTVPSPPMALYTKKEVAALADLKGIKFRTYSPSTARIADLGGMVPTTVAVGDLAQAFGTGAVDAVLMSSATGVDSKSWDFVSRFYDVQAWFPRTMIVINSNSFRGLPADQQKALLAVAAATEQKAWSVSRQRNEEFKKALATNGITASQPSAQLRSDLARIGKTMTEEWIISAGPDGQAIVEAYRK